MRSALALLIAGLFSLTAASAEAYELKGRGGSGQITSIGKGVRELHHHVGLVSPPPLEVSTDPLRSTAWAMTPSLRPR